MYLNDWLSRRNLYTPQRVAVVDDSDGHRYRYCDLESRAVLVAYHLQSTLDVAPGDRVACLLGNRIEHFDLYFACGKVGAVLVPLNVRLPPAGIIELLEDCRAKVLVYESRFAAVAAAAQRAGVVSLTLRIDGDDSTDPGLVEDDRSAGRTISLCSC